jgi:hypothetical protein
MILLILAPFDVTFKSMWRENYTVQGRGYGLVFMLDQEDWEYALECAGVVWGESKLGEKEFVLRNGF